MIAGEQRTTEEAKAEEKAEAKTAQEKQLENQFYPNAYGGNKPTTTHYAPQGFGYNKNSVWGRLLARAKWLKLHVKIKLPLYALS